MVPKYILVIFMKLRRPFGTALRASASISRKFHSKMLRNKKCTPLATAAVLHGSATQPEP